MIAILCPTRGRPEQCKRMIESVIKTSSIKVNIIVGLTASEYISYDLEKFWPNKDQNVIVYPVNLEDMLPTAHKWNLLAEEAMKDPKNKLFMLGADDMIFETSEWDKALIDHYNALQNKINVYALQDSRDADGTPHIIATREYIDAMGYFVPPIFLHWNIDTWTVAIAKANGCFTHLRDYKLTHDKPSDRGESDETHSRIRQWGWHSRDKYVAEKMAHVLEYEKFRLMNGGKPLMYGIPGQ